MTDLGSQLSPPTRNASQDELNALVGLYSAGRLEDALDLAERLIDRHPACEITHNVAGAVAVAQGRLDLALALYDRAIEFAPDYAEAWNNRGSALKDLQRPAEALASFDTAIALQPDYSEAHLGRAIVLRMEKRGEEALASVDAALACNPALAQARTTRGNVLQDMNRHEQAVAEHDRAIALQPEFAQAHLNRGNALLCLKRLDEAVAGYDRALNLAPHLALAHVGRGAALRDLNRLDEALASFEAAHRLAPDKTGTLAELVALEGQMCAWAHPDRRAALLTHVAAGETVAPFRLLAIADDPALQLANARRWCRLQAGDAPAAPATRPRTGGKIRIGYFSADLYNHAVMVLMIRMLELHDKARFEIHAFAYGPPRNDPMRRRVEQAVDAFHDIGGLSDEAAAEKARAIGIDVAVDVTGHTASGRPGIFAARAAPRQVGYLGYPGTTGSEQIDYLIADPVLVPEQLRAHYSETVLHLPGSYQPNDNGRVVSDRAFTRGELGLPENGFVFCSLNNSYKISPTEFAIWMRLLTRVDGSVLWLLEDNRWMAANLRREAEARGIDPARLVFAPRVPMADHLARQRQADLFLDTFAYNAHTTASEALWVGLPVVTKLGQAFAARVAASLLHAVGLPELVTETDEAYEALALALATDPARLAAIRARLAAGRSTATLFDTPRYTRAIEALFERVIDRTQ